MVGTQNQQLNLVQLYLALDPIFHAVTNIQDSRIRNEIGNHLAQFNSTIAMTSQSIRSAVLQILENDNMTDDEKKKAIYRVIPAQQDGHGGRGKSTKSAAKNSSNKMKSPKRKNSPKA